MPSHKTTAYTSSGDEDGGILDETTKRLELFINQILRREVIPKPRVFIKGHNTANFIRDLRDYISSLKLADDKEKIIIALDLMDKQVATAIRAEMNVKTGSVSFNEFITIFDKYFNAEKDKRSVLTKLLELKQSQDQTAEDYLIALKIKLFENQDDESLEEKQKILIEAFLNGLYDKELAYAIKYKKLTSMDEILQEVKKQSKRRIGVDSDFLAVNAIAVNTKENEIIMLRQEVRALKTQLDRLMELLGKSQFKQIPANFRNYNSTPRPPINTRPAKFTPLRSAQPLRCFTCNQLGHIARFCKNRTNRMRFIHSSPNEDEEQNSWHSDLNSVINEKLTVPTQNVCMIRETRANKQVRPPSSDEVLISKWAKFVEDSGKKPSDQLTQHVRKIAETVISKSNNESAHNKPLVEGRLNGQRTKLFLDSGAETNLISMKLLTELQSKSNDKIRFQRAATTLRCANGTTMKVLCNAKLNVSVGPNTSAVVFRVVDDVFPKAIIGIRTQKQMGISIDAASDCARIMNVVVPFISKVDGLSEGSTMGNVKQPICGVEVRLQ